MENVEVYTIFGEAPSYPLKFPNLTSIVIYCDQLTRFEDEEHYLENVTDRATTLRWKGEIGESSLTLEEKTELVEGEKVLQWTMKPYI